jgi:hypothetical protein
MRAQIDAPRPESLVAELAAALAPESTGLSPAEHARARADGEARPTPSALDLAISYCSITGL